MGHEINNPLAIIMGRLQILLKECKNKTTIESTYLTEQIERINIAGIRIRNIVNGLRAFARSDQKDLQNFDINEAITESVNLVKEIYSKEGVEISFTVDNTENQADLDQKSFILKGSRGRFQQILMNLINNAKDATEGNDKPRRIQILVKAEQDKVQLAVIDNGRGMSKEIKDKMFNPFFTTKDVNKGTGMGLSFVHNIIKELNGSLQVQSAPEEGTTFNITLPVTYEDKLVVEEAPSNLVENRQEEIDFSNYQVLIVDDEPAICEILQDMLNELKLNVTTTDNAKSAIDLCSDKSKVFDLVITDLKMPQMDGPTFIKTIKESSKIAKKPKIIAMTGGVNTTSIQASIKDLADAYFLKPFEESDVIKVVQSVLTSNSSFK